MRIKSVVLYKIYIKRNIFIYGEGGLMYIDSVY